MWLILPLIYEGTKNEFPSNFPLYKNNKFKEKSTLLSGIIINIREPERYGQCSLSYSHINYLIITQSIGATQKSNNLIGK